MESNVVSTGVQQSSSAQKTSGSGSGGGVSRQLVVTTDYHGNVNPLVQLYKTMRQFQDACHSCMSRQVNYDEATKKWLSGMNVTVRLMLQDIPHYLSPLDEKLKKDYNSDDDAPSTKLKLKKRLHSTDPSFSFNEKHRKVSTSLRLPTGFKFLPTDEQLIENLFAMMVPSNPFSSETRNYDYWQITFCDNFYRTEPWFLPGKDILEEKKEQLYFYVLAEKKEEKGSRINRKAGDGSWWSTSKEVEISSGPCSPKGFRKAFKYYKSSKNPKEQPTDWIMYEYRVDIEQFPQYWTICKISRSGRRSIHGEGSSSYASKETAAAASATVTHDQAETNYFNLAQPLLFQQQSVTEGSIGPSSESYYHTTTDGMSAGGNRGGTSNLEFETSYQETSGNIQELIINSQLYQSDQEFPQSSFEDKNLALGSSFSNDLGDLSFFLDDPGIDFHLPEQVTPCHASGVHTHLKQNGKHK